jgi:transposase
MTASQQPYRLWCGIDVAAITFTATWTTDRTTYAAPVTLPQTSDGVSSLQQHLTALAVSPSQTLIVLEATGSYWVSLAVALHAEGFRGKTDPLDARMLTHYAHERQPRPWSPPPQVYHELRQRLSAREALASMRQNAR